MGDRTDCRFLHLAVFDEGFDSWWCESRSRLQLGRRSVRLETPSLGGRHLFHCRQDLPNWLESSDRYKVKVLIKDGLFSSRSCHNDGSVELLGWEQWQFLQGLSSHGLGFKIHGGERRKSDRLRKLSGNGRKNEETGLPKGKVEGEFAGDRGLRKRDRVLGETRDWDAKRRVGKEMRWILCFGSGNMS
ncbi:hypothetical protein V6N13_022751 [Hibiscus sabdariffa]|uniref:Uncharacterized protein n=1 Tax=Hibiscus sabdariffa TaxID=183260 RepID=A0ABR1ZVR1_9ROSI